MTDVVVLIFEGKNSAQRALDKAMDDYYNDAHYWLDDVAVISRNRFGHTRVHSTWAQDSNNASEGGAFGALTGTLIGALFGPAGALAGLVSGGALGAITGQAIDFDVTDPRLEELKDSLEKDTSALVLAGNKINTFIDLFSYANAKLIKSQLSDDEVAKLSETA